MPQGVDGGGVVVVSDELLSDAGGVDELLSDAGGVDELLSDAGGVDEEPVSDELLVEPDADADADASPAGVVADIDADVSLSPVVAQAPSSRVADTQVARDSKRREAVMACSPEQDAGTGPATRGRMRCVR